ncbi:MAG TPA: ABC transporter ATP-binding protein [Dehalococcoidia bacterium]|nr:ABC transporter ATP-binding protein [Dehalococcoidia bacterium]
MGAIPDLQLARKNMIQLEDVTKAYESGGNFINALDQVSINIREGEFVVVLGPSGSGKTTLLNIMGCLETVTSGQVVIGGQDVTNASRSTLSRIRRQTVSFVFQSFNLFPALTAQENVQFGMDVAGRRTRESAAELLIKVGLEGRMSQFPHQLSGGEQQRVAVARALATGNPVLLADEPTGELDFRTGVRILQLLQEQVGPGRVVIVVTHNREIARMADRVIELSSGKIVRDGPPQGGRVDANTLFW